MKDLRNTTNLKPKQLKIKSGLWSDTCNYNNDKKLLLNQREKLYFAIFSKIVLIRLMKIWEKYEKYTKNTYFNLYNNSFNFL